MQTACAGPVTMGLPLQAGQVRDVGALTLLSADMTRTLPLQCEPMEHWPDGSIRWVLLDWLHPAGANEVVLALRGTEGTHPQTPSQPETDNPTTPPSPEPEGEGETAETEKPTVTDTPADAPPSRPGPGGVTGALMKLLAQARAETQADNTVFANPTDDETETSAPASPKASINELASVFRSETADEISSVIAMASTPPLRATWLPAASGPWSSVLLADGRGLTVEAEDLTGGAFQASWHDVREETSGPLRRSVRAAGRLTGPAGELADVELLLHTFAGLPIARVELTVRNGRASAHPGGCWDLGNEGAIYFRRLTVALGGPWRQMAVSALPNQSPGAVAGSWTLWQASSGKPNWQSTNHLNRHHEIPIPFRGYRLTTARGICEGLHATPLVIARGQGASLGLAVSEFWQNFPQSIEGRDGSLLYHLFPPQMPDAQELSGGEQKTWTFHWAAGGESMPADSLAWCRERIVVTAEPDYYASTGALPYFTTKADGDTEYAALVDAAIEGDDTFDHKRDVLDEYGWRHFGDLYGDHEAVFHKGPSPLVSHYNNQYDAVLGMALQGLRSGDARWLTAMSELARHVIDIDIYHTAGDKSAYNGGLFWHTVHYIDADTTGHRTYPAKSRRGGGPSPGHLYTSGLMHVYWLTGDRSAREAAIGLGQFVIDCDDGTKTVFRSLSHNHTGLATESAPGYHGPGRASGNALNALLDAHRLSGERRFLDKAQQIIRRCIHPADDIDKHDLLNTECRWFYTMFLQSLAKFLDYKAELDQVDDMVAYARASLLHYARWMAAHEYPYLDQPEKLEYPTETWAAQDMRKSEVFAHAVRHAVGPQREEFRERCEFFFRDAVAKLTDMPTRTLARPVVLLLTNGLLCQYLRQHPDEAAVAPTETPVDFGRPEKFRPQKRVAIGRAKFLAVTGAAVVVAGVAAFVWWLVK